MTCNYVSRGEGASWTRMWWAIESGVIGDLDGARRNGGGGSAMSCLACYFRGLFCLPFAKSCMEAPGRTVPVGTFLTIIKSRKLGWGPMAFLLC